MRTLVLKKKGKLQIKVLMKMNAKILKNISKLNSTMCKNDYTP